MEDVRMSNFAYSQTKIAEYLSFYFAMIGIGSSIIASEIAAAESKLETKSHSKETWCKVMWIVTNASTFFLSIYYLVYYIIVLCIIAKYVLFVSWMKTKNIYSELDNLFNTGNFKYMMVEILLMLIMPYPHLYGATYLEYILYLYNIIGLQMKKILVLFLNGMTSSYVSV
jgi:hypothetical protein